MIGGIVLAGGTSSRMGKPKALLVDAGGRTFVETAVATLLRGGCGEVVVVVNEAENELLDAVARVGGVLTWGAGPGSEQIESLRAGLKALPPEADAAVVLPVDHPEVAPRTVRAMIDAFEGGDALIVQLRHRGQHGHPVLFAAPVFDELGRGDLPDGARTLIERQRGHVRELNVDDPGILVDVDTPEAYRARFGREP